MYQYIGLEMIAKQLGIETIAWVDCKEKTFCRCYNIYMILQSDLKEFIAAAFPTSTSINYLLINGFSWCCHLLIVFLILVLIMKDGERRVWSLLIGIHLL